MTKAELVQWLNRNFDDDAIIEIVMHTSGTGYYDQGGNANTTEFNPCLQGMGVTHKWCENGHFEYTDFTNNQFVKENHPYFNKKILTLGGYNQ